MNPHQVTRDFEAALCEYTGAPYAVAVSSCTMALLLACAWQVRQRMHVVAPAMTKEESAGQARDWNDMMRLASTSPFEIPARTYVSVPMSIIHAGGRVMFRDEEWVGAYQLKPYPIWDCARRFTSGMYVPGQFQCVSFHAAKILGDTQGGAILHDSGDADAWLRRMRFDGRTEGVAPADDNFREVGFHCYLSPDVAARLLLKLSFLPRDNADLPNDDYPDLSAFEVFQ